MPPLAEKVRLVGVTVRLAGAPCETVTCLVIPPPLIVTVALRELEPVFADAVTVTVPLLLPLVGLTLIQLALSLTVHDTLEFIVIV